MQDIPLHPTIVAMLQRVKAMGLPALSAGTPADARMLMASGRPALGPGPDVPEIRHLDIPTRAGRVPARLIVPEGRAAGLLIYLHGGGWVIGTLADFEMLGRALAVRSGCAVLLLDYRLAPEHPYPAGLDDAEDAAVWAHAQRASLLGWDAPLVIGGDSAGGNLAAVAALRLRGRVPLAGQALIYPVTGCDFETASYHAHGTGLVLTRDDMRWFFAQYAPPAAWADPAVSPLLTTDLHGAAPATVVLAGYDVLHDEGAAYAARLRAAGVPVTLRDHPALTHGFIRWFNLVNDADAELSALAADIRAFCQA